MELDNENVTDTTDTTDDDTGKATDTDVLLTGETTDDGGDDAKETKDTDGKDNDKDKETKDVEIDYADLEIGDLPKGVEVDKDYLESIYATGKEHGITKEQMQALVKTHVDDITSTTNQSQADYDADQEEQIKAVKADREIGGHNYEKSINLANNALSKYDNDGSLVKFLEQRGLSNSPEFVRLFARIGNDLANGGVNHGSSDSGLSDEEKRVSAIMGAGAIKDKQ